MSAYYNENDTFAAAWLRELIKAKLIADGEVDERSIELVRPDDLRGFTQCHFFAGIGGWSYALRLAGWPDDREVWTGSCPCQPFSQGGLGAGAADARHLWPVWYPLLEKRQPRTVFGEQVAGTAGRAWWDAVACDLETCHYATAAAIMPAASVGAFDFRYRLYWLAAADSDCDGLRWEGLQSSPTVTASENPWFRCSEFEGLLSAARQLAVPAGRHGAVSDGVSGRVGRLRGYGNAINPQVAQVFIEAYCEARGL